MRMKRKKIGVLIGALTQNYSDRVCRTIGKKAEEYGYDVYFFTTFNSYGDNLLYSEGEQQILSLPDYESMDGVIVAWDTINIPEDAGALLERLRQLSCPVISLRMRLDGFYNVLVDERVSMERMIRHFVDVHGFRDICFMTGRMELEDARDRFDCYKRVMEESGIEVTDDMIFYGDYWKNKAKDAVAHFISSRTARYPEVIICANDYMALAVCRELGERGIRVPDEICVSGYDDLLEAQHCEPPLTTIAVDFESMASRAMELLDEIDHGETPEKIQYVSTQDKYRESCGCKRHKVKNQWYSLTREVEERKEITHQTIFMNADMEGLTDEKELLNMAHRYSLRTGAKKMWVCLCDETEEMTEEERSLGLTRKDYTKTMILRSIKGGNNALHLTEERFDRKELLPESEKNEEESTSYYFIPLHYKNHNQGYVVSTYDNFGRYSDFMQPWAMNFAIALENFRLHTNLNAMADIRRLYKQDALTGISNRRGFEEKARKILGDANFSRKRVAVISMDMDNLKKINDAYGHSAGDEALCRIAKALTIVGEQRENIVYARTGGDEFLVACRIEKPNEGEELVAQVREVLANLNDSSGQPFRAEISCGVYEVKDTAKVPLARALEMSDERMYEDKRQRKAVRND